MELLARMKQPRLHGVFRAFHDRGDLRQGAFFILAKPQRLSVIGAELGHCSAKPLPV